MSANPPFRLASVAELGPTLVAFSVRHRELVCRVTSVVLFCGIAILYFYFPTKNYYWDGISFASAIESSTRFNSSLIHPHHLLYNAFGFVVYRLTGLLGFHFRAVEVLQFSNCILSVGCAALLARFLQRALQSYFITAVLVATFSFSSTWWKYSTDADSYVLSVLFLLVGLNLLLGSGKVRSIPLALAHVASMCFHQLAIFFFPAVIVGIFLQKTSLRERVRLAVQYTVIASSLILALNYLCFHLSTGLFAVLDFWRWLTLYVQGPDAYSFSFDLVNNLCFTLRGAIRLFFEGRLNWISGMVTIPVVLLIALLAGIVFTLLFRFVRYVTALKRPLNIRGSIDPRLRPLCYVCGVWLITYLGFLFFWYPYFTPYRLFYLPAVICLLGVLLVQKKSVRTPVLLLVTGMAISNFVFFILPMTHSEKYPPLAFALQMNESWSANTTIYFATSNADNQLVRYFSPATTWRQINSAQSIENELQQTNANGGTTWLETSAIDQLEHSAAGTAWLSTHARINCRKELNDGQYRLKFVPVFPVDVAVNLPADCGPEVHVAKNSFK